MKEFSPNIRERSMGWEASIEIPYIGHVTVRSSRWEDAKIKLWLIQEAVKAFSEKHCPEPSTWTDEQWKSTLQTMRKLCFSDEC